ncbi:hypothetical protein KCH_70770 [Kitasatospora cheerisanensis KCTC 2395]|uniref:Uncharacterized protein n=1 Tax=Kitasatospora cheerisanensis KCTC 2395 TaxID=1348663 RepID=A0A066YTE0_9ACTN|nr:hypothetical protein KCH_70770 [Kitasatospora cheerisanensis KCTC 2395]
MHQQILQIRSRGILAAVADGSRAPGNRPGTVGLLALVTEHAVLLDSEHLAPGPTGPTHGRAPHATNPAAAPAVPGRPPPRAVRPLSPTRPGRRSRPAPHPHRPSRWWRPVGVDRLLIRGGQHGGVPVPGVGSRGDRPSVSRLPWWGRRDHG